MADELEQPYMLSKDPMEEIESEIAALETRKKCLKNFSESDKIELKRLKRQRNARLYRQKVKLRKRQEAHET